MILGLFRKLEVKFEGELTDIKIKQISAAKKLFQIKDYLMLNFCINSFNEQCYKINEILMEKQLFLGIYKKRNKFRYLIRKPASQINTVLRNVFSCAINRFNGYDILKISQKDCIKSTFSPLDIVYNPGDDTTKNIEC